MTTIANHGSGRDALLSEIRLIEFYTLELAIWPSVQIKTVIIIIFRFSLLKRI